MTNELSVSRARHIVTLLPNALTMTSLVLGISAIIVLADRHFITATIFIIIASILDVLDGQLAQRLKAVTAIGAQLDSLADMVTFGVAPTVLIYYLMTDVGISPFVALGGSILFAVAGAIRLARYNVLGASRSAYFTGLPIPLGCALVITGSFWQHWTLDIWWLFIVALVGYLMISPLPYPKVVHIVRAPASVWLIASVFVLVSWRMAGWQVIPFTLLVTYTILGPIYAHRTDPLTDDAYSTPLA